MGQPPDSAIPAGHPSISRRQQQLASSISKPLTPTEMYDQIVQPQRGFLSSPGSAADATRQKPATVTVDPNGVGTPVGKGYETFAAVQVLDKEGRRVAISGDFFNGGGLDNHAEARAMAGLEQNGPAKVPNGTMVVVTEKDLCSSCEGRLTEYARKRGISNIEVYMPTRDSMTQAGKSVTGKQAARTSFMGGRPATTVRQLRRINVVGLENMPEIPESPGANVRTAVVGTLANIGAGIVLGILQEKFKEEMKASLGKLPKPVVDKRRAGEYFSDPNTARALRMIDLLNKNLQPFMDELQSNTDQLIVQSGLEIGLMQLSKLPDSTRIEFFSGLEDQLNLRANELSVIRDNVQATRDLAPGALDASKSAEDLSKLVELNLVAEILSKQGFTVEEIAEIYNNFRSFSSNVRYTFTELAKLSDVVAACLTRVYDQGFIVNRLLGQIFADRVLGEMKKRGVQ